ncbi:MAG: response regulator transcription factor [Bacteroidetes bacterium]|nr:response regulator transcription factor [Bacteroidota bacterium]
MNTALIIDNELHDAEKLIREIKKMDHKISIGGVMNSIEQSVEWLEKNPSPDLIFMDVNLKDGDSFKLFNHHPIKCPVIFTVYYEERMIRTFDEKRINYLLKPVQQESFRGMLTRVKNNQRINYNCHLSLRDSLLKSENAYLTRLIVRNGNEFDVLRVNEVAFFVLQQRNVFVVTSDNRKFVSNKPLHVLDQELDPTVFYRVNRQLIVNGNIIASFRPLQNGSLVLKLKINHPNEIVLSRFCKDHFMKWIEKCDER